MDEPQPLPRGRRKALIYAVMGCVLLGIAACAAAVMLLVVPSIVAQRDAAMQSRTESQIQAISQALDSYHASYGKFPAAFTTDADGQPLLSWRVALLPFLGDYDINYLYILTT